MTYSRQHVIIHTKIKDKETLKKMIAPILSFVSAHGLTFDYGWNNNNEFVATYEAEGRKSAYCKGMVAEVKQMLKEIFNCKIEVVFYAY